MRPLAAATAGAARLTAAGVPSPRHDAEALVAHVLEVRRTELALAPALDDGQQERLSGLLDRRAARVPLQHLLGRAGFRRLELLVGPGVFVPRPETESVVQWALDALRGVAAPRVVDLCSGSGTIALALADELGPDARVYAVERDPGAYSWLTRNIEFTGLAVAARLSDAVDALPGEDGTFDLVVSNPPYVAEHERGQVEPEVAEHDPEVALFAGSDGLDVVRVVERAAARLLRPGGLLVVEHSDRQGETAPALLRERGWLEVADHRDLAGRDRFVTGRAPGPA